MASVFNIFKDGLMMSVHVSFWSGAKQLNPEDLGLKKEDVADAYRLGKKMLIPDDVIREFRKIEARARNTLERNSFSFPIGNARFVPHNRVEEVTAELKDCQKKYMGLVEELVENYDLYRQEMIPVYTEAAEHAFLRTTPEVHTFGIDYDREAERKKFIEEFLQRLSTYYPSVQSLWSRFSLTWDAYEITVPRSALSGEYQEQMRVKIGSFVEDVVKVLRNETLEVCARLKESLDTGKAVHGKTLNSMASFVERFQELNFVGDTEMEDMLVKLRADILSHYRPEDLKHSENLRNELRRRIQDITDHAEFSDVSKISGQYKRQIQWNEDTTETDDTPVNHTAQARKIQSQDTPEEGQSVTEAFNTEEPSEETQTGTGATEEVQEGQSVTETFSSRGTSKKTKKESSEKVQEGQSVTEAFNTEEPSEKVQEGQSVTEAFKASPEKSGSTPAYTEPKKSRDINEGQSVSDVFGL
jgi:hypothetical protein